MDRTRYTSAAWPITAEAFVPSCKAKMKIYTIAESIPLHLYLTTDYLAFSAILRSFPTPHSPQETIMYEKRIKGLYYNAIIRLAGPHHRRWAGLVLLTVHVLQLITPCSVQGDHPSLSNNNNVSP